MTPWPPVTSQQLYHVVVLERSQERSICYVDSSLLLLLCVILCYLNEQMHFAICFIHRYSLSVVGNKCVHAGIIGLLICLSANKSFLRTDIKLSVMVISVLVCQTEIQVINKANERKSDCFLFGFGWFQESVDCQSTSERWRNAIISTGYIWGAEEIRGTMGRGTFYLFFSAAGAELVVFFFFSQMTLLL